MEQHELFAIEVIGDSSKDSNRWIIVKAEVGFQVYIEKGGCNSKELAESFYTEKAAKHFVSRMSEYKGDQFAKISAPY